MKRTFTFSILILFTNIFVSAQTQDKVLTVFVLNFAKYTQWPETMTNGNFVIGVSGTTTVAEELRLVSGSKAIGNQKIQVKEIRTSKDYFGCHLVFIADDQSSAVPDVVSKLSAEPTLIVTERSGLAKKGGGISFLQADGKLRFEINRSAIEKKGLKVSSSLINLGNVVGD